VLPPNIWKGETLKKKTCVSVRRGWKHFLFTLPLLHFRIVLIILLNFSLLTACSTPPGNSPTEATGYSINITHNTQKVAAFTVGSLAKLEQMTARNQEHDSTGPLLISVIKLAGISDFNEVKIVGVNRGRIATAEITLLKPQISERTILDITNRGTAKFTDAVIPFENWIYDITEIDVK
jgi:hypothetical protein